MVLFYTTQMGDFTMLSKPQPGQEDYGITYSKDEKVIMEKGWETLIRECSANRYVTYPIGFYKEVTLNESKQLRMFSILAELTGLAENELEEAFNKYGTDPTANREQLGLLLSEDLTYDHFKELMKQADKLLGGGSNYGDSYLLSNARVPKTYEEALQEYEDILQKDHLSGAYARLFSDYMGIILTILPVFLAVTRGLRDKRARASQVIYARKASSLQIVLSRYLAMLVMVLLPILIMSGMLTVKCAYNGINEGITVDYLAFIKYSFGWLLPAVMISTSVGVFLTELTQTAIAIIVMGLWWFISLFMGVINIGGGYGLNLIPRHNTFGGYEVYHDNFGRLAANRFIYAVIAILLMAAAAVVFDLKRKGKLIIRGKVSSNRKSKP
jgi:ABC-type transport system involved in multi-copper enzyme maturation permease subunit